MPELDQFVVDDDAGAPVFGGVAEASRDFVGVAVFVFDAFADGWPGRVAGGAVEDEQGEPSQGQL